MPAGSSGQVGSFLLDCSTGAQIFADYMQPHLDQPFHRYQSMLLMELEALELMICIVVPCQCPCRRKGSRCWVAYGSGIFLQRGLLAVYCTEQLHEHHLVAALFICPIWCV